MNSDFLRPGTAVECAISYDDPGRQTEVRKALIFDTGDNEIVVSQTSPPLVPSLTGKQMSVTYINKKEAKRLGLSGEVDKIVSDYPASDTQTVPAIILKNITAIKSLNLRYTYRVRPPAGYDISLSVGKDKNVQVIDLSASGIKFSHMQAHKIELDQKIFVHLHIRGKRYVLKVRVIRKEQGYKIGARQFEYVAARFTGCNKFLEDELAREVREIERYSIFHGVNC